MLVPSTIAYDAIRLNPQGSYRRDVWVISLSTPNSLGARYTLLKRGTTTSQDMFDKLYSNSLLVMLF
jgi:hypothetical protein